MELLLNHVVLPEKEANSMSNNDILPRNNSSLKLKENTSKYYF